MRIKKIPVLVLVLAAIVLMCASCSRQEETQPEPVQKKAKISTYWVYNNTREVIREISLTSGSRDDTYSVTSHIKSEGLGENHFLTELSGYTDLPGSMKLSYMTENGSLFEADLPPESATVTLLPGRILLTDPEE